MKSKEPDNLAKTKLLDELLEDDEGFADRFAALDSQLQRDLLMKIRSQHAEYQTLVNITLRLKKLILATHKISASTVFSEMVDRLVNETCENLLCDRASVFMVDELNGELWTSLPKRPIK